MPLGCWGYRTRSKDERLSYKAHIASHTHSKCRFNVTKGSVSDSRRKTISLSKVAIKNAVYPKRLRARPVFWGIGLPGLGTHLNGN